FSATAIATVSIVTVLASSYASGGSWLLLLDALRHVGVTVVPGILISALRLAGINVALNTTITRLLEIAERNAMVAKILSLRVTPKFIEDSLGSIGINIKSVDLTIKNVT